VTKKSSILEVEDVLKFANGIETEDGEKINQMNSKDWRERFLDNLPFRMDDIMIVNMPEAPVKV
jgi:hypothetical protein